MSHQIQAGQIYESCQPTAVVDGQETHTRIRVIRPPRDRSLYGHGKVDIVTLNREGREIRPRAIEASQLHATATTRDGRERRAGYRLVEEVDHGAVRARRPFHLGDILTITTGILMAPRGVEVLYDLLGFMTGETLLTHELVRAADECAPCLLEQHPDLADITTPPEWKDGDVAREAVEAWLAEAVAHHGETRDVAPLAAEHRTHVDPLIEMERVKPGGAIVVDMREEGP
ncbi:hypothetical protein [Spirillospora sp. CA-294931]|uniref:DUF7736 domain-containing protein n=1 Tax=Spirillospora sp. CA-294931 TaxID=3240042 RepID=UPI003D8F047A